ncbi:lipocalin family protein [Flavobacterium sp. NG2]|uniref:lipocalin family protein n=1 Tax=Flavobacterium sp. NG2 TaxID=3097547 RepID=UPI002A8170E8|nr:lipocalin family protein [Flavobacterium sp. NG2]WPR72500.1 lipocalin family protein [Flavobacterium sp. NG2]
MKKSILIFAFLIFTLFSCSNNDNDSTTSSTVDVSKLSGTWLLDNAKLDGENVSSSYKIVLTSDNIANFYYQNKTSNTTYGPDTIETGPYLLNNTTLKISWYGSGTTTNYQIIELTSVKFVLKSIIPNEGTLVETYKK